MTAAFGRHQALDEDSLGRAHGEKFERARWLVELVKLVEESGTAGLNPELAAMA